MSEPTTTTMPPSADSVTVAKAAAMTGFSQNAIRRKIERGDWLEGYEYHRSPTGAVTVFLPGYARWAKGLPREHG